MVAHDTGITDVTEDMDIKITVITATNPMAITTITAMTTITAIKTITAITDIFFNLYRYIIINEPAEARHPARIWV